MTIWLGNWGILVDLDELRRRLRQEWRRPALLLVLVLLALVSLWVWRPWVTPPKIGYLKVTGAEAAKLDGDDFPVGAAFPLPVGRHTISASWTGWYPNSTAVTVSVGITQTVNMVPSYPRPAVLEVLPGAPGYVVRRPTFRAGTLRYESILQPQPVEPAATVQPGAAGVTSAALELQRWELRDGQRVRLFELEAYGPVADQQVGVVAYTRAVQDGWREEPLLVLMLHRGGELFDTAVYTSTGEIYFLEWAPGGRQLVFVQHWNQASRLCLWDGEGVREVLTFPGQAYAIYWGPGGAFALLSRLDGSVSLTLVDAAGQSYYLADVPAGEFAQDLVPLAWGENQVLWSDGQTVREAAIGGAARTRLAAPARGLFLDAQGNLWYILAEGPYAVIYQEGHPSAEFSIDEVEVSAVDLAVLWSGQQLLLTSGESLYLLDFGLEARW